MKNIIYINLLGSLLVLGACGGDAKNEELEERVSKLEDRVNSMSNVLASRTSGNETVTFENTDDAPVLEEVNVEKTSIQFYETSHNFGDIITGDQPIHTFKFKNTGSVPLIISDAKASCGCTVPSKPEKPIAPGADGEIQVQFNSAGKSGSQAKTVTVTSNTDPGTDVLSISANVLNK